jgi:hypothetical protein
MKVNGESVQGRKINLTPAEAELRVFAVTKFMDINRH